ncbi:RagB/SusD family nutrient uptake outer membrane protein [Dyadobacter sp. LHD-138]|uniref:RagB/SusD family nutrient uptake outer membrane protein n=1 Tax=Dyadobacter sp. LHD-138 TaxID=3071413 RepID=UPI0027DEBE82|nr:RagB/SusD family nutrient uptake outer membrane protein [Dyadobacter sp. LHD-138]MDQ6477089.1 RagB/SusD family nutrient uptake outer membrane protein [Dyadobacter sp. LHD-138]
MKRIYLLLITGFFLTSCNDEFLTKDHPTATTDENFWNTEGEINTALNAIYEQVPTGQFQYRKNTRITFEGMTDNAVWYANFFGEVNTIALGNANSQMRGVDWYAVQPVWEENYIAIRRANRFLEHAGKALIEPNLKKRYFAEARALRAWLHLDLFLYYGEVPIVTTVVLPTETDLKRNSRQEILDFVVAELDAASADLPATYAINDIKRITKGACYTMKTVALLNNHQYSQAAAAAKQVIDLNLYKLHPNYATLFNYEGQVNEERIFIKQAGNNDSFYRSAPGYLGGNACLNPTGSLMNAYETKQGKTLTELGTDSMEIYKENPSYKSNRDPRMDATIAYPGSTYYGKLDPWDDSPNNPNRLAAIYSSKTGYWLRKYVDLADKGKGGSLDYMIYRYGDLLLMYVEALVESGKWNDPDVVKYLNQIRNRAKMPNVDVSVYNSEAKIRELYRRERRIELAFEGSRLFDIRRWKIGEKVMHGIVEGAVNPKTKKAVNVETRTFSQKDYLWPIPAREMEGNPNMTQNPGY